MIQSAGSGMRRVLYLITGTGIGGTERSLLQLCRRLDRRLYHPTVVSLKREGPTAAMIRESGVEVISLGMREAADAVSAVELLAGRILFSKRVARGRTFDLLHAFLYRANLFSRIVAPLVPGAKLVNSVRVTPQEESPLMRLLDRWTAGRVDRVCVQSRGIARELVDRLGLPPGKVAVLPNGIDPEQADRALAAIGGGAREALGLSRADPVVVSIGRLHRQKGFDVLLEAFRALARRHPRSRLLIGGDGPERQRLRARCIDLGLGGHVSFLGAVADPWEILAAADIFVLPSRYEGMPNVLLEAMSASLPVVATAVGAVPEMVRDGGEGYLVAAEDDDALLAALDRLARHPELRRRMGRQGRHTVEARFSMEASIQGLQDIYDEVMRTAPSRTA